MICLVILLGIAYAGREFLLRFFNHYQNESVLEVQSVDEVNASDEHENAALHDVKNLEQNSQDAYPQPNNQALNSANHDALSAVNGVGESHLTSVDSKYTNKDERVHRETYQPLMDLIAAAQNDGIRLKIVSAYRSYAHQKRIWERKWADSPNDDVYKAQDILRYSSFPGTSRHHWGTDIDFNSVELNYWETQEGRRTHQWLLSNAPRFGFCQVYAPGRTHGYEDEPWHWSHMPTAAQYFQVMSQPNALNVVVNQKVLGAPAVASMQDELMGYITSVSSCNTNLSQTSVQASQGELHKPSADFLAQNHQNESLYDERVSYQETVLSDKDKQALGTTERAKEISQMKQKQAGAELGAGR
ncbi:D-alanyl-D-alanine carboxypeptidase [Moraxella caviae]|uniref:D-alanyl-D-alanine carboxypeptidase n=1 Tax=Moraxella caviae TaxID=34060 RepID=A0A378R9H1_9GAMM|nr:D-alanyl-D-alanine carboxypeptidase [Moraxella caviae]VEW10453.1 D-alanyl-D-alanine carboxypeptidase [Moraxella caviae]